MANNKYVEELHKSVDAVLRTPEGRALFAHLFNVCGYNRSSTVADPANGAVLAESTAYNEARRGVYIHLRQLASYDLLKAAEEIAERTEIKSVPPTTTEK